jgi:hypothetical protein
MPFCGNCGSQMAKQDQFCKACGAAAAPSVQAASPISTAQPGTVSSSLPAGFIGGWVIALIGFVMLVIGPFLPWMTVIVFSQLSVSGLQKTNNEALVLVILGIIGVAFAVVSLALKRGKFTWVPFVAGLVSLAMSIWDYVQLRNQLAGLQSTDYSVSLGTGIYLCLVASVVVLIGAVVVAASRKPQRA